MRISLACCLLSCVLAVYLLFFFSSFPFSISIWTSFFHPVFFLVGTMLHAVSSVSVSAATRLAYDVYLDT